MKARIVLAGLLVSMMVVEVSAQGAEYDDMYFRGKDRERNKAIDAEEAISAKTKKQSDEVAPQEDDNSNPTDTYSARNVNPEYVSRSNSEKASEDESNYYLEGYTPTSANSNFNNSYYNNANWASNSFYGSRNDNFFNRGYGCNYCGPQMSWMITSAPYYPFGYYDSWMSPYGYGPSYGWRTGWSVSFMYGGYGGMYNPYYGGYGNPYYGGGYPGYYYGGGNNNYYESPRVVTAGKRPSNNSATITPSTRPSRNTVSTNSSTAGNNTNTVSSGRTTRVRQSQDEYYVRPSRRTTAPTSTFDTPGNSNSRNTGNSLWTPPSTQPTRTRDNNNYDPPTRTPSNSPSYSPPSSSPSRGSGGSGGSSSPRPRGGRD